MRSRSLAIAALCLLAFATGCGRSGHGAETDPEKGSDAATLNGAMGQELTLLQLYREAAPRLRGRARMLAVRLRSQEQEYVDAITKSIRGLGGDVEAEAEELEPKEVGRRSLLLLTAAELETSALDSYIEASPRLNTGAPRMLAAALAAGHAQHLVVLRQVTGSGLIGSIPRGFETAGEG